MRKAKQIHGDTAKWIKDKSECLAKMSKGAGHVSYRFNLINSSLLLVC